MSPTSSELLPGYTVGGDGYDEAVAASGETRPAWLQLSRSLSRLTVADLLERQRQADRLVEAEGASYLFHDNGRDTSRPWRLDPVPLVLGGAEWATIERGVAQRMRLLDRVLADCYGERRLMRNRVLPPAAVFGSPGYTTAAQELQPASGRWIVVYAVDLLRLADGTWRVLRDVTDAPSGAGYALVNRNVSAQLFPDAVRDAAPLSLAPFFADMRAALEAAAPPARTSPRTVVLSGGLGHPSYFEHSYLAAHLGYHLAETGDLVVRDGSVWLRSLSGLESVDVLLRRVDSDATDPLESTGEGSEGGVPGLTRAARNGTVGLANALGAGLAGSMTLLPFLPSVAKAFGEELELGSLDTLWCGTASGLAEVFADPRRFVLHDVRRGNTVFGSQLDDAALARWRTLAEGEPYRLVAQEKADFATGPVLGADGIRPATSVLRVLAVAGKQGITVMPGGLARVMDPSIPIVRQVSGLAKDVWVLDDRPDRPLPISVRRSRTMPQVDLRESLPTRAAEAMYWVGRNAERAEAITRATLAGVTMMQSDPALLTVAEGAWRRGVTAALRGLTRGGAVVPDADGGSGSGGGNGGLASPEDEMRAAIAASLTGDDGLPASLMGLSRAASSGRQFLSATTWRLLGELGSDQVRLGADVSTAYDAGTRQRLDAILVNLSSLSGLFNESTVRGPAWRFLEIGRRVDRAFAVLTMFESVVSPAPTAARNSLFDYVLATSESLVAYRRRYRSDAVLDALVDLLVLDDSNPRALAFQLDQLRSQLTLLPARDGSSQLAALIDDASAALIEVSWLSADADQRGADGRRAAIDRFVTAGRAPLLSFAGQLVTVYFNDPTRMRQLMRAGNR